MAPPPPSIFPLRWESTGDQWWYASPIDWAAANGHYDLVRELLHIDPNLLIKLTSLRRIRRIRRLEALWDDDPRFLHAARCRAAVARSLLHECDAGAGAGNSLLRAGYGGWLLYTAASAGDEGFVAELLRRDPLMVFGEGEFGVTDVLYAAARSGSARVFRALLEAGMSPRCSTKCPAGEEFRWEMRNRAAHAAARGGALEVLREVLGGCTADVLAYRDVQGSSLLHAAAGRGQVQVVKGLLAAFNIIGATDNQGNTSLHVAAFRGHLAVVEALISACPASISSTNQAGDTFLHLAIYGFRTPGFRRLDRQMELVKKLVSGDMISISSIINIKNNDGRTILHLAVVGNVHYNLVSLLMKIPSMDLNIRDVGGMTPLDLLNQRPKSATSELLVRQMVSAGGTSNKRDFRTRSQAGLYSRMHGTGSSPGTCFKISDAEIFLHAGIEALADNGNCGSGRASSSSTDSQNGLTLSDASDGNRPSAASKSRSSTASRLKSLFHWPRPKKNKKKASTSKSADDNPVACPSKKWNEGEGTPTPLRQRFSKPTSLQNNKRALAVRSSSTSPTSKKKFAAGLRHGVIDAMPHLDPQAKTPQPPTPPSRSSMASPTSDRYRGICTEIENEGPPLNSSIIGEATETPSLRSSFVNSKLMNQYLCFGAHGLSVDDPNTGRRSKRFFKRSTVSTAAG